jgi:chitinase
MQMTMKTDSILKMMRNLILATCLAIFGNSLYAQMPVPALVGYLHNWNDPNAPYLQPVQVDPRYNVVDVAFAVPSAGTDYRMEFIPDQVTPAVFLTQVQSLQAQGRKVIISIGGANAPVSLDNTTERDTFVATMNAIITAYGFDGIDIDLEGSSLSLTGGTIASPVDAAIIHLVDAVKQIMADYYSTFGKRLILTMAPETAFVQGGMSAYGGIWGAYLPVIHALRDSLALLHVQLYNSGSMYGIDGSIYTQGTVDFIIAMTEAVIQGFSTAGGFFQGLSPEKVAVGLPACSLAAGGGYTDTATVAVAVQYLLGTGPQPGSYTLATANGYPTLGGMMTWSVNWDAGSTCGTVYSFAENFNQIFGISTSTNEQLAAAGDVIVWPNPASDFIHIADIITETITPLRIYDYSGRLVMDLVQIPDNRLLDIRMLKGGLYFLEVAGIIRHRTKLIVYD